MLVSHRPQKGFGTHSAGAIHPMAAQAFRSQSRPSLRVVRLAIPQHQHDDAHFDLAAASCSRLARKASKRASGRWRNAEGASTARPKEWAKSSHHLHAGHVHDHRWHYEPVQAGWTQTATGPDSPLMRQRHRWGNPDLSSFNANPSHSISL